MCRSLIEIVNGLREQPKVAKEIFHSALTPMLPHLITLLQLNLSQPVCLEEIFSVFLALFESTPSQLGVEYSQSVVATILAAFGGDQLHQRLSVQTDMGKLLLKRLDCSPILPGAGSPSPSTYSLASLLPRLGCSICFSS